MRVMPELLRDRAQAGARRGGLYLPGRWGARRERGLTWGELDRRASALAAGDRRVGGARRRALILCPPGLAFIPAFFGALRARRDRRVRLPAAHRTRRIDPQDRTLARLRAIASDAAPAVILAPAALAQRAAAVTALVPELARSRRGSTSTSTARQEQVIATRRSIRMPSRSCNTPRARRPSRAA